MSYSEHEDTERHLACCGCWSVGFYSCFSLAQPQQDLTLDHAQVDVLLSHLAVDLRFQRSILEA